MITIDVSQLRALNRRAKRLFDLMPARMLDIGKFAARFERETHSYTNRTGKLEASTLAYVAEGNDEVTLSLVMDTPYASYVNKLGYSNIDEAAELVEQQLFDGLTAMADELGSL
jgi:hypothetical protein